LLPSSQFALIMLTIDDLKQLIHLGGGVRIHAGHYAVADLKACALLANSSRAHITLMHAEYISVADMKAIAHLAPGQVVFDLVGPVG
jgi:hypothetical protein